MSTAPPEQCADSLDDWSPSSVLSPPPQLDPVALHGLAGEVVAAATHDSEAAPAAVLATFLARFGCEAFVPEVQSPHVCVGEARHYPRLFVSICGQTSKARKGTSAKPVERLFQFSESAAGSLARPLESPGPLSSGEGLIYAVRDPSREPNPQAGNAPVPDTGARDKRLFVLDEEMAAALKVTKREGNILSTVLRGLWDSGKAAPITKNNRVSTSNAHVCVVSHITRDELVAALPKVELLNGFGNRFLWILVHREKMVPLPRPMPEAVFAPLQRRLMQRLRKAHALREVPFTAEARRQWEMCYPSLSLDRPGLVGAVTSRAEAQTIRLALLYALLDGADSIGEEHLGAGLAFWHYAEASARCLFDWHGENPLDERILLALYHGPLSATGLSGALHRNYRAAELKPALERLTKAGLVKCEKQQQKNSGRPSYIYSLHHYE